MQEEFLSKGIPCTITYRKVNLSLKVGSVEFLNSKPLNYGFGRDKSDQFRLILGTPSNLATSLKNKEIDVGLVPVMEYLQGTGKYIIRDCSIASRGSVGSVFLLRKKGTFDFEKIAVDNRSRSSVALLKIVLLEEGKSSYTFQPFNPKKTELSKINADAVLLIGDEALIHGKGNYTLDLGEWWFHHTKLPFVYAIWVSNVNLTEDQIKFFKQSKEAGLTNLDRIITNESNIHGISRDILHEYYTSRLVFDLGNSEIKGIQTFQDLLLKHGLLKGKREIVIY